jgi:hypothetical protein
MVTTSAQRGAEDLFLEALGFWAAAAVKTVKRSVVLVSN